MELGATQVAEELREMAAPEPPNARGLWRRYPGQRLAMATFVGLQCMDLLTTLAVFARGGVELNPFVRSLMPWTGRLYAVVLCKLLLMISVIALSRRKRILRFANVLYVCIVAWNVWVIYQYK